MPSAVFLANVFTRMRAAYSWGHGSAAAVALAVVLCTVWGGEP